MSNNPLQYTVEKLPKSEKPVTTKIQQFNLLLYPDTDDYVCTEVLSKVENDEHISSYAYIAHTQDYFTEDTYDKHGHLLGRLGERKKDHVHVSVSLKSKMPLTDVAMFLGISQRFIEKTKSFDSSLLYLCHTNAEDKHQYNIDEVHTNIRGYIEYLQSTYETKYTPVQSLYRYLEETKYPSLHGFVQYFGIENANQLTKYWSICERIITEAKTGYLDKVNAYNEKVQEYREYKEGIKTLCEKFGSVKVEQSPGKFVTYKLTEDGKVDIMGYQVGEE